MPTTYRVEFAPDDEPHADDPFMIDCATLASAKRLAAQKSRRKDTTLAYCLAVRNGEAIGQIVYAGGREDSRDGEI